MKQQLDIFGEPRGAGNREEAPGAPTTPDAGAAVPAKPRRRRKSREAKKAPMLVDACGQGAESGGRGAVRPQPEPEAKEEAGPRIYTISEITGQVKELLEGGFPDIWVSGEITDFRGQSGRHLYFSLKDAGSKLPAVIFNAQGMRLSFDLADGLEVICHGKLNLYAPYGKYSILVDRIEPKGVGALQLAFEQLKKKLEALGLFARERKRALPFLPRRIGVVTSPTGAAVRDVVHVLTRRFPTIEILLHPARVQGEGAAADIAEAIERMNSIGGIDLLIVGRGGGSIEDLWPFNEEAVARAIAASRIPVISAVGHEIDFTIADFVADLRAATPSAAAELAVPVKAELILQIAEKRRRLAHGLSRLVAERGHMLARLVARMGDPGRRIPDLMLRVDEMRRRLSFSLGVGMEKRRELIAKLMSNLEHLSPLGVLAKGYSVATAGAGTAVTRAKSLKIGEELSIRFHEGAAKAKVTKIIDE
ncbi:MAG TPA: exodeoxyribonuclease VII large subunit [bacterium]|nr:exodeoxyribonuclease VII large subunit [bacterium]